MSGGIVDSAIPSIRLRRISNREAPEGETFLAETCVIRAGGGACFFSSARNLEIEPDAPSARITTAPGVFVTHPEIPDSAAIRWTKGRNPTPWTTPRMVISIASAAISPVYQQCGILSRMDAKDKKRVEVERSIQQSADEISRTIRSLLASRGIFALNMISSPGSGKTTLIEALLSRYEGKGSVAVIEGDIETEIDADRIRRHGVNVRQINTRSSCHIQPVQLLNTLEQMDLSDTRLLIVENVGNLVCPAEISLGEDKRIVLLSVTEGDEKPLKYPLIFKTSDILVITKTDLLPYVRFNVESVRQAAKVANPAIEIFELSAVTGEGMPAFLDRIESFGTAKTISS